MCPIHHLTGIAVLVSNSRQIRTHDNSLISVFSSGATRRLRKRSLDRYFSHPRWLNKSTWFAQRVRVSKPNGLLSAHVREALALSLSRAAEGASPMLLSHSWREQATADNTERIDRGVHLQTETGNPTRNHTTHGDGIYGFQKSTTRGGSFLWYLR